MAFHHITENIPPLRYVPPGWTVTDYAYGDSVEHVEAVVIAHNPRNGCVPWVCWSYNKQYGGCGLGEYGATKGKVYGKWYERTERIKRREVAA